MQMATSIEVDNGEMIVKRVSVPIGLEELMEGLTKEVIMRKPNDIYEFASQYFTNLLQLRQQGGNKGIAIKSMQSITKPNLKQAVNGSGNKSLFERNEKNKKQFTHKATVKPDTTKKYPISKRMTPKGGMNLKTKTEDCSKSRTMPEGSFEVKKYFQGEPNNAKVFKSVNENAEISKRSLRKKRSVSKDKFNANEEAKNKTTAQNKMKQMLLAKQEKTTFSKSEIGTEKYKNSGQNSILVEATKSSIGRTNVQAKKSQAGMHSELEAEDCKINQFNKTTPDKVIIDIDQRPNSKSSTIIGKNESVGSALIKVGNDSEQSNEGVALNHIDKSKLQSLTETNESNSDGLDIKDDMLDVKTGLENNIALNSEGDKELESLADIGTENGMLSKGVNNIQEDMGTAFTLNHTDQSKLDSSSDCTKSEGNFHQLGNSRADTETVTIKDCTLDPNNISNTHTTGNIKINSNAAKLQKDIKDIEKTIEINSNYNGVNEFHTETSYIEEDYDLEQHKNKIRAIGKEPENEFILDLQNQTEHRSNQNIVSKKKSPALEDITSSKEEIRRNYITDNNDQYNSENLTENIELIHVASMSGKEIESIEKEKGKIDSFLNHENINQLRDLSENVEIKNDLVKLQRENDDIKKINLSSNHTDGKEFQNVVENTQLEYDFQKSDNNINTKIGMEKDFILDHKDRDKVENLTGNVEIKQKTANICKEIEDTKTGIENDFILDHKARDKVENLTENVELKHDANLCKGIEDTEKITEVGLNKTHYTQAEYASKNLEEKLSNIEKKLENDLTLDFENKNGVKSLNKNILLKHDPTKLKNQINNGKEETKNYSLLDNSDKPNLENSTNNKDIECVAADLRKDITKEVEIYASLDHEENGRSENSGETSESKNNLAKLKEEIRETEKDIELDFTLNHTDQNELENFSENTELDSDLQKSENIKFGKTEMQESFVFSDKDRTETQASADKTEIKYDAADLRKEIEDTGKTINTNSNHEAKTEYTNASDYIMTEYHSEKPKKENEDTDKELENSVAPDRDNEINISEKVSQNTAIQSNLEKLQEKNKEDEINIKTDLILDDGVQNKAKELVKKINKSEEFDKSIEIQNILTKLHKEVENDKTDMEVDLSLNQAENNKLQKSSINSKLDRSSDKSENCITHNEKKVEGLTENIKMTNDATKLGKGIENTRKTNDMNLDHININDTNATDFVKADNEMYDLERTKEYNKDTDKEVGKLLTLDLKEESKLNTPSQYILKSHSVNLRNQTNNSGSKMNENILHHGDLNNLSKSPINLDVEYATRSEEKEQDINNENNPFPDYADELKSQMLGKIDKNEYDLAKLRKEIEDVENEAIEKSGLPYFVNQEVGVSRNDVSINQEQENSNVKIKANNQDSEIEACIDKAYKNIDATIKENQITREQHTNHNFVEVHQPGKDDSITLVNDKANQNIDRNDIIKENKSQKLETQDQTEADLKNLKGNKVDVDDKDKCLVKEESLVDKEPGSSHDDTLLPNDNGKQLKFKKSEESTEDTRFLMHTAIDKNVRTMQDEYTAGNNGNFALLNNTIRKTDTEDAKIETENINSTQSDVLPIGERNVNVKRETVTKSNHLLSVNKVGHDDQEGDQVNVEEVDNSILNSNSGIFDHKQNKKANNSCSVENRIDTNINQDEKGEIPSNIQLDSTQVTCQLAGENYGLDSEVLEQQRLKNSEDLVTLDKTSIFNTNNQTQCSLNKEQTVLEQTTGNEELVIDNSDVKHKEQQNREEDPSTNFETADKIKVLDTLNNELSQEEIINDMKYATDDKNTHGITDVINDNLIYSIEVTEKKEQNIGLTSTENDHISNKDEINENVFIDSEMNTSKKREPLNNTNDNNSIKETEKILDIDGSSISGSDFDSGGIKSLIDDQSTHIDQGTLHFKDNTMEINNIVPVHNQTEEEKKPDEVRQASQKQISLTKPSHHSSNTTLVDETYSSNSSHIVEEANDNTTPQNKERKIAESGLDITSNDDANNPEQENSSPNNSFSQTLVDEMQESSEHLKERISSTVNLKDLENVNEIIEKEGKDSVFEIKNKKCSDNLNKSIEINSDDANNIKDINIALENTETTKEKVLTENGENVDLQPITTAAMIATNENITDCDKEVLKCDNKTKAMIAIDTKEMNKNSDGYLEVNRATPKSNRNNDKIITKLLAEETKEYPDDISDSKSVTSDNISDIENHLKTNPENIVDVDGNVNKLVKDNHINATESNEMVNGNVLNKSLLVTQKSNGAIKYVSVEHNTVTEEDGNVAIMCKENSEEYPTETTCLNQQEKSSSKNEGKSTELKPTYDPGKLREEINNIAKENTITVSSSTKSDSYFNADNNDINKTLEINVVNTSGDSDVNANDTQTKSNIEPDINKSHIKIPGEDCNKSVSKASIEINNNSLTHSTKNSTLVVSKSVDKLDNLLNTKQSINNYGLVRLTEDTDDIKRENAASGILTITKGSDYKNEQTTTDQSDALIVKGSADEKSEHVLQDDNFHYKSEEKAENTDTFSENSKVLPTANKSTDLNFLENLENCENKKTGISRKAVQEEAEKLLNNINDNKETETILKTGERLIGGNENHLNKSLTRQTSLEGNEKIKSLESNTETKQQYIENKYVESDKSPSIIEKVNKATPLNLSNEHSLEDNYEKPTVITKVAQKINELPKNSNSSFTATDIDDFIKQEANGCAKLLKDMYKSEIIPSTPIDGVESKLIKTNLPKQKLITKIPTKQYSNTGTKANRSNSQENGILQIFPDKSTKNKDRKIIRRIKSENSLSNKKTNSLLKNSSKEIQLSKDVNKKLALSGSNKDLKNTQRSRTERNGSIILTNDLQNSSINFEAKNRNANSASQVKNETNLNNSTGATTAKINYLLRSLAALRIQTYWRKRKTATSQSKISLDKSEKHENGNSEHYPDENNTEINITNKLNSFNKQATLSSGKQKKSNYINAVIKVQSLWRGFQVRKQKNGNKLSEKSVGRSSGQNERFNKINKTENMAFISAVLIQKMWRGYIVRKNIKTHEKKLIELQDENTKEAGSKHEQENKKKNEQLQKNIIQLDSPTHYNDTSGSQESFDEPECLKENMNLLSSDASTNGNITQFQQHNLILNKNEVCDDNIQENIETPKKKPPVGTEVTSSQENTKNHVDDTKLSDQISVAYAEQRQDLSTYESSPNTSTDSTSTVIYVTDKDDFNDQHLDQVEEKNIHPSNSFDISKLHREIESTTETSGNEDRENAESEFKLKGENPLYGQLKPNIEYAYQVSSNAPDLTKGDKENKSATKIQSIFRGYSVRRNLEHQINDLGDRGIQKNNISRELSDINEEYLEARSATSSGQQENRKMNSAKKDSSNGSIDDCSYIYNQDTAEELSDDRNKAIELQEGNNSETISKDGNLDNYPSIQFPEVPNDNGQECKKTNEPLQENFVHLDSPTHLKNKSCLQESVDEPECLKKNFYLLSSDAPTDDNITTFQPHNVIIKENEIGDDMIKENIQTHDNKQSNGTEVIGSDEKTEKHTHAKEISDQINISRVEQLQDFSTQESSSNTSTDSTSTVILVTDKKDDLGDQPLDQIDEKDLHISDSFNISKLHQEIELISATPVNKYSENSDSELKLKDENGHFKPNTEDDYQTLSNAPDPIKGEKLEDKDIVPDENKAATKIQSLFRGYSVRRHSNYQINNAGDETIQKNNISSDLADINEVDPEVRFATSPDQQEKSFTKSDIANCPSIHKQDTIEEISGDSKKKENLSVHVQSVPVSIDNNSITVPVVISRASTPNINEARASSNTEAHNPQLHLPTQSTAEDNSIPVQVQLNEASAGTSVLTSQRNSVEAVQDTQSEERAQALFKDASTCAIQADNTAVLAPCTSDSMETEKRNNNASLSKKNMEVEAATKIQAGFRGYQVRKQMKEKSNTSSDISSQKRSSRRKSSGRITESSRIQQPKHPADLEEKSAVKIQAGIRGFLVRRRQKKQN